MTIEEAEKAVEEARFRLAGELVVAPGSPAYWEALDALIEAVRQAERERADVWAGELCWYRGPHSFSPRCNQRRDHVVHDGVCYGCDGVPHSHHGFIPAQATDEYYEERACSSEEAGNGG